MRTILLRQLRFLGSICKHSRWGPSRAGGHRAAGLPGRKKDQQLGRNPPDPPEARQARARPMAATMTLHLDPSAPWKVAVPFEPAALPWNASKRTHFWLPQKLPAKAAESNWTPSAASELRTCRSTCSGEPQARSQPQVASSVTA